MRKYITIILTIFSISYAGEEDLVLKEGKNKELVQAYCSACHSVDYIMMNSKFLDKKGWEAELDKMIKLGAPISKEDSKKIIDYLVKNYGINK
jgi:mono/diheme cytochrome c family protein